MFRLVCASILVLANAPAGPADDLPKWLVNLAHIQRIMREEIGRLPNYTCVETIDRSQSKGKAQLRRVDRILINVAVAGGHELYAWPGRSEFQEQALANLVAGGFTSDGNFSGMAQKVFFGQGVRTSFVGEEMLDGRQTLHYAFNIPADASNWMVRTGDVAEKVAARGSFLVDATTFDLLMLEFAAENLPPGLNDKTLEESIRYARVTIAGHAVLLPKTTEIRTETFSGDRFYNHARFDDCHEYGSQSTITFDSEPPAGTLPAGLEFSLRLDSGIDLATASVGDPVRAILIQALSPLHEGAVFTGAIGAIRKHPGNDPRSEISLEWTRAEDAEKTWSMKARLGDIDLFPDLSRRLLQSLHRTDDLPDSISLNGLAREFPPDCASRYALKSRRNRLRFSRVRRFFYSSIAAFCGRLTSSAIADCPDSLSSCLLDAARPEFKHESAQPCLNIFCVAIRSRNGSP